MATYNAFSYCNNNPINYLDYTGHEAGTAITYICLALIFIGFLALYAFFISSDFFPKWQAFLSSSIDRFGNALFALGTYITNYIVINVKESARRVSLYIAERIAEKTVAPQYPSSHEVHHIVAQTAGAAKPARDILEKGDVNISVNADTNLVPLKTGVHKHLHTTIYYEMVNYYIINSYMAVTANESARVAINRSLTEIKAILLAISNASPF
ncbi:AHH domain-containing protein [Lachnoclostridium phytofermentans]|uniref:AHH domain-containing protein n=1 Tax=Lachnoclostridium phytofermentans TaxID=66219 RepID=UPI00049846F8|nr:AHH domain-containing protein [Lachnoclostridium phytofermentans]